MRRRVCFLAVVMLLSRGVMASAKDRGLSIAVQKNWSSIAGKVKNFWQPTATQASVWQTFAAGAVVVAMLCTSTGCGAKLKMDRKYHAPPAASLFTSFAAQAPLAILASQEKISPAFAGVAAALYAASFILLESTEFYYGEGGHHVEAGGVDWYGMNNDFYSEYLVYGIRLDGQQQFEARRHDLEPLDYHHVLVHLRHNGRDYAAVVERPWQPRRFRRYPRGLQARIRIPSHRPPPPKPTVSIVESLQPHDKRRVPLDAVMGVYLTDHPDYSRDEWVTITDGERLLYGKITHHFNSDYAQVRILAVEEDGNQVELPEDIMLYRVYPQERLQRE